MPIEIKETFQVRASVDEVWGFLLDPNKVVLCMPGAELQEVVDDRNFKGNIRVKVGPIVVSYKGDAEFTDVDEENHVVHVLGRGQEKGGSGRAKGTMVSSLTPIDGGSVTEVSLTASVDVTGRVMQLGARMVEGVSQQLIREFIVCARSKLETPAEGEAGPEAEAEHPKVSEPIPLISVVLRTIWNAIVGFFKRLFRRGH